MLMRVLFLYDAAFLEREAELAARLEVGLADEGVRIFRGVPESLVGRSEEHLGSQEIGVPSPGLFAPVRMQATQVLAQLPKSGDDLPVDVIHAFGEPLWALGARLAHKTGAALALEVWKSSQTARAVGLRIGGSGGRAPVLLAPDQAIASRLEEAGAQGRVRVTRWGVHAASAPRPILRRDRTIGVVFMISGRDPRASRAALLGAKRLLEHDPDAVLIAEAEAAHKTGLWAEAGDASMLRNLSLIDRLEQGRDLLMRADMLLVPEVTGEHRSMLLSAMGSGMLVAAVPDPDIDAVGCEGVLRLQAQTEEAWAGLFDGVLRDPDNAERQAASGWSYVRQQRRASTHIASVLDAYEWMCSGDSVPIGDHMPGG